MKVVIQRVRKASVSVDGSVIGAIEKGVLVLVGIHGEDTRETVQWVSDKIIKMRIFDDGEGKMNLSAEDINGEFLIVPQFTLYGDASKGNWPSYTEAADPDKAEELFDEMVGYLEETSSLKVETGRFGAYMNVELVNDGPVTIILEK